LKLASAAANEGAIAYINVTAGTWYVLGVYYYVTAGAAKLNTNIGIQGITTIATPNAAEWTQTIAAMRAGETAMKSIYLRSEEAASTWYVDAVSLKPLTLDTLLLYLANVGRRTGTWQCAPTITANYQSGLALNYASTSNFVLAYVDRHGVTKAYLEKCIDGAWTTVISGNVAYGAGKALKVIVDGTNYSLYYDGVQIGVTTAIADAGLGTKVCGFATDSGSTPGAVITSKAVS
jgi:hypothetical protein